MTRHHSVHLRGTIVWLTPEQGGRIAGPPTPDYDEDYTATAYVPPLAGRQAGIALRNFAPHAWRSPVEGVLAPTEAVDVVPGSVVIVTEGLRAVGILTVEEASVLGNVA